ncbi:transcription termination factor NusA [Caldilinea sp.]|uniref:transcription termination factor NusA n=1 Tax=Caldilinea sp. TaxID=2293560 RepID=UPI001B1EF6FC|nr:transcription termination factor NusA [Caldilinea sp.]MBO9394053.1 transcription termination/antitermination protein NusA [Caldilinea sp.]
MSKALIAGINQVATDKGLDREVIFEAIEAALVSAYKRNYGPAANITAKVDRATGEMRIYTEREVVEEVLNERTEITLDEAKRYVPNAKLGDVIAVPSTPNDFGRIAAQTAKQVILQRIREAERDTVYENFAHRIGEVITAQVRSIDAQSGAVTVMLDDKHECLMLREDQIPTEKLRRGDYIKVYVVDVQKNSRGPVIKISRTHRNLLRRLMEQEIPEVREGKVEIKAIAREPGYRSKVAVQATVPGLDAVGSCVGMRGLRIQNIVNELAGEKIDVIEWDVNLAQYISNALSPAKVQAVLLDEEGPIKTATVVVPDRQLSLAIGKEGQNARLAAKLTGWRIDIKSESEARAEGLDRIIAERAQEAAMRATEDLLARAEQILRSEGDELEDRFLQAMQALRTGDEVEITELPTGTFKSFEEVLAELDTKESAKEAGAFPIEEMDERVLPPKPSGPEWPELPLETPALADETTSPTRPTESKGAKDVETFGAPIGSEELPEVITADMLRARMAERKKYTFSEEDFEIPPELLKGYEEEDDLLEHGGKGKGKVKGKKSAPKPKGKSKKPAPQRPWEEDDDF